MKPGKVLDLGGGTDEEAGRQHREGTSSATCLPYSHKRGMLQSKSVSLEKPITRPLVCGPKIVSPSNEQWPCLPGAHSMRADTRLTLPAFCTHPEFGE